MVRGSICSVFECVDLTHCASSAQWPDNSKHVHSDSSGLESGVLVEGGEVSGFGPVNLAIQGIDALHNMTGLPWWATIPLTAVTIRTVLMPLTVQQVRIYLVCTSLIDGS